MGLTPNYTEFTAWSWATNDVLMSNSVLVSTSAAAQKSAYDNWQIMAKTQYGILDKENQLVLSLAQKQDKSFKAWETYVSGGG